MSEAEKMVEEFHRAYGVEIRDTPRPDETWERTSRLRRRLHIEENKELADALFVGDPGPIARELADVIYVAYGTAISLGIDLDAALAEVHRANMAKLGPDGRPVLRDDGKVLKPEGWQPPDLTIALNGRGA